MSLYWGKNIRIDGTWIQIDEDGNARRNPDATGYESRTHAVVRSLAGTALGGLVLNAINRSPGSVQIRPLADHVISNTAAIIVSETSPDPNVNIWFSPESWRNWMTKFSIDAANHMQPDDVLFHELFHALRRLRKLRDFQALRGWHTIEEFYAIILTNVYISSRMRDADVRGSHELPFQKLDNTDYEPKSEMGFYTLHAPEIDRLCNLMPDVCGSLWMLPIKWNPFRARRLQQVKPPIAVP